MTHISIIARNMHPALWEPAYRPEIIDQNIKDAQNDHQHHRAPFGLEPHHHHHTSHESKQADHHPSNPPVAGEHEADEQEYQQHSSSELKIHFTVLLIDRRQSGRGKLFAHPRVTENHEESTHDAEVTQEKVQVEDKAVAKSLGDHNGEKAEDGVIGVFARDDENRADAHGKDIDGQEEMRETPWDWGAVSLRIS